MTNTRSFPAIRFTGKDWDFQSPAIPRLGDPDANHWQSIRLRKFKNTSKIIQKNWNQPDLASRLNKLNDGVSKLDGPIVSVAHSLAVSLVLHWTQRYPSSKVKGAMLVAPADVDFAEKWGCDFIKSGFKGHTNPENGKTAKQNYIN